MVKIARSSHERIKEEFIILSTALPITKVRVQQLFLPMLILMKRWRKGVPSNLGGSAHDGVDSIT